MMLVLTGCSAQSDARPSADGKKDSKIAASPSASYRIWKGDPEAAWNRMYEKGLSQERGREPDMAADLYEKAIDLADKSAAPLPERARVMLALARVMNTRNRTYMYVKGSAFAGEKEAIRLYKNIISSYESTNIPRDQHYAAAYFKLGWTYYRQDKYAKAWPLFRKAIDIARRCKLSDGTVEYWQYTYGVKLSENKLLEKSEAQFKEAVIGYERLGKLDTLYKYALTSLMRINTLKRRLAANEPLLKKILALYYANRDKKDGVWFGTTEINYIADACHDAGEALFLQGKMDQAKPLLLKAETLRKDLRRWSIEEPEKRGDNVRKHPEYDLAYTLKTLALFYQKAGDTRSSVEAIREAVKTIKDKPPSYDWAYARIIDTASKIGKSTGLQIASAAVVNEIYDNFDRTQFKQIQQWEIDLEAASRLQRVTCTHVMKWEDKKPFFRMARKSLVDSNIRDMRLLAVCIPELSDSGTDDIKEELDDVLSYIGKDGAHKELAFRLVNELSARAEDDSYKKKYLLKKSLQMAGRAKTLNATAQVREYTNSILKERGAKKWKGEKLVAILPQLEKSFNATDKTLFAALDAISAYLEGKKQYYDAMVIQRKIVNAYKQLYGPKSTTTRKALLRYAKLLLETNDREGAAKAKAEAEG